ncbi:MAG: hypothetical protein NVS1B6_03170 [Steroidobacteraceae bacterium]
MTQDNQLRDEVRRAIRERTDRPDRRADLEDFAVRLCWRLTCPHCKQAYKLGILPVIILRACVDQGCDYCRAALDEINKRTSPAQVEQDRR